jgi:hypothetical protein
MVDFGEHQAAHDAYFEINDRQVSEAQYRLARLRQAICVAKSRIGMGGCVYTIKAAFAHVHEMLDEFVTTLGIEEVES